MNSGDEIKKVFGGVFMAMIKCCDCGKEVWEGSKICVHCGGEPFFNPYAGKVATSEEYEEMAVYNLHGKGKDFYGEQKYEQAFECFSQAAAKGIAESQYYLGLCYMNGQGVPQDYGLALVWYKKAAAQNCEAALNNLGAMYFKGNGVPEDRKKGYYYFLRASGAGSAPASANLGLLFEKGLGVPQDYKKAVELYNLAIAQGNPDPAVFNHLGVLYMEGKGAETDCDKAREMFEIAVERGSRAAKDNLALLEQKLQP